MDAACASSLYAIKIACDRLQDRALDLAVAGAVNCCDDLFIHVGFCALQALSRTGRSRPFHADADGLVPAEGAAFVALKRLDDAVADGDTILGVIRGVGLSNDGRGRGLLVPSEEGQMRAMRAAYACSGMRPGDVTLLECHATGTPVGDGAELRSTGRVFVGQRDVPLGSLKSNLGHLITAAGAAGLIKVLGAIREGVRPPTLHATTPHPALHGSPFRLLQAAEPWRGPRRAAVSAFGFGGNNAHLLVEEYTPGSRCSVQVAAPRPDIAVIGMGVVAGELSDTSGFEAAWFDGRRPERQTDAVDLGLRGLRFPPADLDQALGQQTLILRAAFEALDKLDLPRVRTGVFVGMGCDPEVARYGARWRMIERVQGEGLRAARDGVINALEAAGVIGTMPNIPANRISSQFDFWGPGFTLSSEELSGLRALEVAIRALEQGEIDAAVVGAVDLSHEPVHQRALEALGLKRDCADAAVVLVLRRAEDARADGQRVHALVGGQGEALRVRRGGQLDALSVFGEAHAASGLLQVAVAVASCRRRRLPGERSWGREGRRRLRVEVEALGEQHAAIEVEEDPSSPGGILNTDWRIEAYAADSRAELRRAVQAGRVGGQGSARLAILARNQDELDTRRVAGLAYLARSQATLPRGVFCAEGPPPGELGFVFTGAASAHAGMGRELFAAFPELLDEVSGGESWGALEEALSGSGGSTVLQRLWGASALSQAHARYSQGLLGLRPDAALGLSSGESNALLALGAWGDLETLMADAKASGLFTRSLAGPMEAVARAWSCDAVEWLTLTLACSPEAAREALRGEERAHLSLVYSPQQCAISGDRRSVRRVAERLGQEGVSSDYPLAVHCPELGEVRERWAALHRRETSEVPGVRFYSCGRPGAYAPSCDGVADALVAQAIGTADFSAQVEAAWRDGVRVFVEHGPGRSCSRWIGQTLGARPHLALPLDAPEAGLGAPLTAAAALWSLGYSVDLPRLLARLGASRPTPPYAPESPVRSFRAHLPPVFVHALTARELAVSQSDLDIDVVPSSSHESVAIQRMLPAPKLPSVLDMELEIPAHGAAGAVPKPLLEPSHRGEAAALRRTAPALTGRATRAMQVLATQADLMGEVHAHLIEQHEAAHARFLRSQLGLERGLQRARAAFSGRGAERLAVNTRSRPQAPTEPRPAPRWRAPEWAPAQRTSRDERSTGSPVPLATPPSAGPPPGPDLRPASALPGPVWGRPELEIHASGRISELFGAQFEAQDRYPVQVRMPEPPLLLADRVVGLEAEPCSMGKGVIWTETDVTADAEYLHQGHMPAGYTIESGQADLMLISYLGVDLLNLGERAYRLLGCDLTYHSAPEETRVLPRPGETLRYEIHVDGHASQGPVRLFFFHYDCTVGEHLRLDVRGGQAGFFTREELDASKGILWTPEESEPEGTRIDPPARSCVPQPFGRAQLEAFAEGRVEACFGPEFARASAHTDTPRIAGGRKRFLDEVTHFEPKGGPWGRGYLRATAPVREDDWYFAGHFKGDPCMPGTLMFEGCLQAMAFYLTAMGFTLPCDGWRFEPIPEQTYRMRCRGQVVPQSQELVYEVFVHEVVSGPLPSLYADLLCTVDGLKAFHCVRMGLRLVPDYPLGRLPRLLEGHSHSGPVANERGFSFDYASLLACAWGRPSDAFGEMYQPFDGPRHAARLPGPPYHFMSRIVEVQGEMGQVRAGARAVAEYDVPDVAWYFEQNGSPTMPFAVLLEAALQPCGWLASFLGSALRTEKDLYFRNLDGTGTLRGELLPGGPPLRTEVISKNISHSGGMIIESFEVRSTQGDRLVFEMNTVFGFFPGEALANQVGLTTDPAQRAALGGAGEVVIDLTRSPNRYCRDSLRLPDLMLRVLDRVHIWPGAGPSGLGQLRSEKDVEPSEWFFKAHFFGDPVQPGSLGIEAMIQLLQLYVIHEGLHEGMSSPRFEALALDKALTWKYRGQIVPEDTLIQCTMDITGRGEDAGGVWAQADASLWVDGKRIYEARGLCVRVVDDALPRVEWVETLEPEQGGWLLDHRPTFTLPALPMMSMVDRLAAAALTTAEGRLIVGLEDVRVKRWAVIEGRTQLRARTSGNWEAPSVVLEDESGPLAEGRVRRSLFYPPGPAPWPSIPGTEEPDPYDSGRLFHGPAFRLLKRLVIGRDGASAVLDAGAGGVPHGALHQGLLDAATHAIPHDQLCRWCAEIPPDLVAYPAFIPKMAFFTPSPRRGEVRCEVRWAGFHGARRFPSFEIQLIANGAVWTQFTLVEALFPKGPLGCAPPDARRRFLESRQHVPGLSLAQLAEDEAKLDGAQVEASDWLPGTVACAYDARPESLVTDVVVKELLGHRLAVHPREVLLREGRASTRRTPLTAWPVEVERLHDGARARLVGAPLLDLQPIQDFWTSFFNISPWPVEDLYYGLIHRFLRRVVLSDPDGLERTNGRSVLYLGNHQVGLESLIFSVVAAGLSGVSTVTLAKIEHKATWLGALIEHCVRWPGAVDPEVISFFDRKDQSSLPVIIGELAAQMKGPGKSVMVHVEGTRSLECRTPVQRMSGAFIDMALDVGVPIIPVRFVGGLPPKRLEQRLEFPVGMGTQDIYFGAPLWPAELSRLPYGERKRLVLQAINGLGPANAEEQPNPGDPAFADRISRRCAEHQVRPEHAVLAEVLTEVPSPSEPIARLCQAFEEGTLRLDGSQEDVWLKTLAAWCFGQTGPRISEPG